MVGNTYYGQKDEDVINPAVDPSRFDFRVSTDHSGDQDPDRLNGNIFMDVIFGYVIGFPEDSEKYEYSDLSF